MPPVVVPPVVVQIVKNTIVVTVADEQTGLPLPSVEVVLNGPGGKISVMTGAGGEAMFKDIGAADITLSGELNGIATSTQQVGKAGFTVADSDN